MEPMAEPLALEVAAEGSLVQLSLVRKEESCRRGQCGWREGRRGERLQQGATWGERG